MDNNGKKFIDEHLYRHFLHFMESADASELAAAITDDIATDIEETADSENWTSGDVDMALARLLLNTFIK